MLVSTLCWGTGNTIFGICVTENSFVGTVYTKPGALFILIIVRMLQVFKTWYKKESWTDKKTSGYYTLRPTLEGPYAYADEDQYSFNWGALAKVVITQALPPLAGVFIVGEVFRLALLGHLNQGCTTVLFGLTSVWISILFYCKLG